MTVAELVSLLRTHDQDAIVVSTGVDCGGYDSFWPTKAVFVLAGNGRVVISGVHVDGNMKRMLTENLQ